MSWRLIGYSLIGILFGLLVGVSVAHYYSVLIDPVAIIMVSIVVCALIATVLALRANSQEPRSHELIATQAQINAVSDRVEYHFGKWVAERVKKFLEANTTSP